MPQRVSVRVRGREGDACHARVRPRAELFPILFWLLLLTLLLPALAVGQAGASLQVAAKVVYAEPSRSALTLAAQGLKLPSATIRESRLAQVTVAPASDRPAGLEIRRVRVDFLRN